MGTRLTHISRRVYVALPLSFFYFIFYFIFYHFPYTNFVGKQSKKGPPIKNGHDALQSLEAIDMLTVTPTFLAMSHLL